MLRCAQQGYRGTALTRLPESGVHPHALQIGVRGALAAACLAVLLMLAASTAHANGGTVQVSNQVSGPYQLSIFTNPNPIRVGTVDVSVLIQRPGGSDVVEGVTVVVTAQQAGQTGGSRVFPATHDQATNKLYYAANVNLPAEGRWIIGTRVEGPDGVSTATFEVEATRESLLDSPIAVVGALAVPVVAVMGWLLLRDRRRKGSS